MWTEIIMGEFCDLSGQEGGGRSGGGAGPSRHGVGRADCSQMAVRVKPEERQVLPGRGGHKQAGWVGRLPSYLKPEVLGLMRAIRCKCQKLLKTAWGKTSAIPVFISAGEQE